jgi:hypothetical protein
MSRLMRRIYGPLLHLPRDPVDRIHPLHLKPGRTLDRPTSTQPRHPRPRRKFSHASDEVFHTDGIKVIRTPVQAPKANAFAERWDRTVRADCLERIPIFCPRHLEHLLCIYRRHCNEHRPRRSLDLLPPNGRDPTPVTTPIHLNRRDRLGGLIHECEAA